VGISVQKIGVVAEECPAKSQIAKGNPFASK